MPISPIVQLQSIHMVYSDGTIALRGVDLEVQRGEIHGLLGENGAGKSTLMKIASGLLPPTHGRIYVCGVPYRWRSPADALATGIGMVHQHFALVPTFTVLQNIVLGHEGSSVLSRLRIETARQRLQGLMQDAGLHAPLDVPVERLPLGVQQRVEILKMLYRQVDVLILDEPTAVLTAMEVEEFFHTLRALRAAGKTVLLITHKLKEVLGVTDRLTVLQQGRVAGHLQTAEATPQSLARLMVGRDLLPTTPKPPARPGAPIVCVQGLRVCDEHARAVIAELSFDVHAGEILGIAGVEGNGQTELVEALTGLRPVAGGRLLLHGHDIAGLSPRMLYDRGLAHVPADRHQVGLVLDFTVAENGILGRQHSGQFHSRLGHLSWAKISAYARALLAQFTIVAADVRIPARSLSGGNQQKLVLARELGKQPSFVVAVQPTRGLDIAATQYMRQQLLHLREQGKAILLVSADLDEIFQLSDRLAVLYNGQWMGIAKPEALDTQQVGLMMGGMALPEASGSQAP
jgi:general nucleoside transport system ATP-binding protein